MMNNYIVFAIISTLAVGSMLATGITSDISVLAQNITMNNSSTPVQNTSDISNPEIGLGGSEMISENMTGSNMTQ